MAEIYLGLCCTVMVITVEKGEYLNNFRQTPLVSFLAWARAFSINKEIKLWSMLSGMAKAFSLGNWGANPEKPEE